jgi:hypothetical protein
MLTTFRRVCVVVLAALVPALIPTSAGAARAEIQACGNATAPGGILIDDISAKRATCRTARRIARAVPEACGKAGSCSVRGYTCFAAQATEELTLARCSKAKGNAELYRVVRFDYGR